MVIGMHRSGTSTTSGIFNILGLSLGSSVIPPLGENPKGFFENVPITALNNRLLKSLGSSWHETYLIRKNWWTGNPLIDFRDELADTMLQQFDELNQLLIKDPRLSVLLPFYLEVFKILEIQPYFVICLRSPSEVAASLLSRNHFPSEKSVLLWMDYMLNAEFHTRSYPRSFILFNDIVQDPVSPIRQILLNFQNQTELTSNQEKQIRDFVEKDLKHHNISEIPAIHPFTQGSIELYHTLAKAKDGKFTNTDNELIDSIGTFFYNQMSFFHGIGEIFASLQVEYNYGLKEELHVPVNYGQNKLVFDLCQFDEIKEITFIPSNCGLGFLIQSIEITDHFGNKIERDEFFTIDDMYEIKKEKHSTNELLFFPREIPHIVFFMDGFHTKAAGITVEIIYRAFGEGALNLSVASAGNSTMSFDIERNFLTERLTLTENQLLVQKEELIRLEKSNEQKEDAILQLSLENRVQKQDIFTQVTKIQEIYDSFTWKAGKLVVSPLLFCYLKFKQLFRL